MYDVMAASMLQSWSNLKKERLGPNINDPKMSEEKSWEDLVDWQQWWTLVKGPASLVLDEGLVEKVARAHPKYQGVAAELGQLVDSC
eukprot:6720778-Lingulodinium_polyedra.AAC.1